MSELAYKLSDVKTSANRKLFTVVTTFAGGGGSSTGYKLAGGDIKVANEFIPSAVDTYKANYPETPVAAIDIRKITGRGRRKRILEYFEQYGVKYQELDLFDGSPPCTTFSTAAAGKGTEKIEKKNVKHSDTTQSRIGMLMHDYVYLVNCLQPKVFLMENVVPSQKSKVFRDAINRLKKHGFVVTWNTVRAIDCGVPQSRERLITIGIRHDIAKTLHIKTPDDLNFLYPVHIENRISLKDAIGDLSIDPIQRDVLMKNCRLNSSYELLKLLPKNPTKSMKMIDIDPSWKKRNSDFTLIRSSWNVPCPTLTCRGQQLGIGGVHHPEEDRKFTIEEMKRLTSLPDNYIFKGNFNQKAERIGNMVPPFMIKTLADSIYKNILLRINQNYLI